MDYIVLFIIILIIILLIIQANNFKATTIKTNRSRILSSSLGITTNETKSSLPLSMTSKMGSVSSGNKLRTSMTSKMDGVSSGNKLRTSMTSKMDGVSSGNKLGKRPIGKNNLLEVSKDSSCTVSQEYKGSIGSLVKQNKDVYYLGNPNESQVYHVFDNIYTYKEAEKKCKDKKGRLATVSELNDSFNKGADWCSWGWASDGRGYMPNKNPKCNKDTGLLSAKNIDSYLRLGANCYGNPL